MLVEMIRAQGAEIVGLVDADPALKGQTVLGIPVLGGDDQLADLLRSGVRHAFLGVGAVGDNSRRRRIWDAMHASGFEFLTVIASSAIVSPSAVIGEGSCVFPGAIIGAGVRLGCNVIVNTGAIIEHDCDLGDHVHVASGAVLAGGVRVGEAAHVGAGSSVKQGVRLGRASIVGLGAAVIEDVADEVAVGGVPAKPLRAEVTR
jgi:sugar O-acyltransferase (sialic acid O-acetyltransferase NeuD family)